MKTSPHWIPEEIRQIQLLVDEIAACRLPRRRTPLTSRLELRLSAGLGLVEGLAGSTRALPVRQLLRALGFDEFRHLRWRMEHKLVQALVLRHWLPEAIPVTCGLTELACRHGPGRLRQFLGSDFPTGYIVKTALGDSSGESEGGDNGEAVLRMIEASAAAPQSQGLLAEKFIVQERIPIATEYRVHSLEEDVVEDLTFRRYGGGSIPGERDAPSAFVQALLRRLPDGLVGGSLLAWDIALQPDGAFRVIEVNFSGFHSAFKRGFHCSGYFHDKNWGTCDTARLLNFVARTDAVEVSLEADLPGHPIENRFYLDTANWQLRHRSSAAPTVPEPKVANPAIQRSEHELIAPLIRHIDTQEVPRHRERLGLNLELRLSDALPLRSQLAASVRALPLLQALRALGFDERRFTPWRLEHKLVQAAVFRHYNPETLPRTHGLDRLSQGTDARHLRLLLRHTFPQGFVIKTALGDCSDRNIDARTEGTLSWIESGAYTLRAPRFLVDERFIVQERMRIRREYRVHTLEDRVVEDLTVHRHEGIVQPGEREAPNGYVRRMLAALPAGLTFGANLAWDVALLEGGSFTAIEVNIGGIHAAWNPGFHASGFFHHQHYGAIYTARLLLFLERSYGCRIAIVADAPEYAEEHYFYSEVADWKTRF